MKTAKARKDELKPTSHDFKRNIIEHKYAYLLILPAIIATIVFCYAPLMGIVIAFKDYNIYDGIWHSPWVGFNNFVLVFQQKAMLKAIGNTLLLSLVNIVGGTPFPILLSILFNEIWNMKFKKVVQTVSYMPYFLSWVSVVGICYSYLSIEGMFNTVLIKLLGSSYEAKNFLMEAKYFIPIAFIVNLWKTVGWSSVIYLAAIVFISLKHWSFLILY